MSNVIATVTTVQSPLAAGQVLANWHFQLLDSASSVVAESDSATPTFTFENVAPGDYAVKGYRLDSTGAVFGSEVTGSVTVPTPVQTGDAAGSITVTLA